MVPKRALLLLTSPPFFLLTLGTPQAHSPCRAGLSVPLTLHVRDQETATCFLVYPVLEGATLLTSLRISSEEVDFLPVSDGILHKFSNQLLFHCGIRDVVLRPTDKENRNDPVREEDMISHQDFTQCLGIPVTWSSRAHGQFRAHSAFYLLFCSTLSYDVMNQKTLSAFVSRIGLKLILLITFNIVWFCFL